MSKRTHAQLMDEASEIARDINMARFSNESFWQKLKSLGLELPMEITSDMTVRLVEITDILTSEADQTYIVTWTEAGDRQWVQCYSLDYAERLYKQKADDAECHEISLSEVNRSTADWSARGKRS